MAHPFDIEDVSGWRVASEEPLGSKAKDWLIQPDSDVLWLWKEAREGTGDDWAEKVAEQLAGLIELPHATVELARRGERRGVICRDFRIRPGRFEPGNELLWQDDPTYPKGARRRVAQHTVARVLERIAALRIEAPVGFAWFDPTEAVFAGYLMFDAWIANQDRHHENWGVVVWDLTEIVQRVGESVELRWLAPSFDHASSLGQYETDEKRRFRLTTKDTGGQLQTWARKARTQLYRAESDTKPLSTFEAFEEARASYPDATSAWLKRLAAVSMVDVAEILASVPDARISPLGREFALRLLEFNRSEILARSLP